MHKPLHHSGAAFTFADYCKYYARGCPVADWIEVRMEAARDDLDRMARSTEQTLDQHVALT